MHTVRVMIDPSVLSEGIFIHAATDSIDRLCPCQEYQRHKRENPEESWP